MDALLSVSTCSAFPVDFDGTLFAKSGIQHIYLYVSTCRHLQRAKGSDKLPTHLCPAPFEMLKGILPGTGLSHRPGLFGGILYE